MKERVAMLQRAESRHRQSVAMPKGGRRPVGVAALVLGVLLTVVGCTNVEERAASFVPDAFENESFAIGVQDDAFLLFNSGSASDQAPPAILETFDLSFVNFVRAPFEGNAAKRIRFESRHGNLYEVVAESDGAELYVVVEPEVPPESESGILQARIDFLLDIQLPKDDPVSTARVAVELGTPMAIAALRLNRKYGEEVSWTGARILGSSDDFLITMDATAQLLLTDDDATIIHDLASALALAPLARHAGLIRFGDSDSLIIGEEEIQLTVQSSFLCVTQSNGVVGVYTSTPESDQAWVVSEETHVLDGAEGIEAAKVRVCRGIDWEYSTDLMIRITEFQETGGYTQETRTEVYALNPDWAGIGWPPVPLPSQWISPSGYQTASASLFISDLDSYRPSSSEYRLLCVIEQKSDDTTCEYYDAQAPPNLVATMLERGLEDGSLERVWRDNGGDPVAVQVWDDGELTPQPDCAWYSAGGGMSLLFTPASGYQSREAYTQPLSSASDLASIDSSAYSPLEPKKSTGDEEEELPRELVGAYLAVWSAVRDETARQDSSYELALRDTTYYASYAANGGSSQWAGFVGQLDDNAEGSLVAYFRCLPTDSEVSLWEPFSPVGYVVTWSAGGPSDAYQITHKRFRWGSVYLPLSVRGEQEIAAAYGDWQKHLAYMRDLRRRLEETL